MTDTDKTVFISYRRSVSAFIARAVFQDLRYNGYDVFMDVESIDAGAFDTVILNQIAARTHFLVILTPGAVERCTEPGDWLRREIEHAMDLRRNVVPLLVNNFDFRDAQKYLTGKLAHLQRHNALTVPHDYFEEAMHRLRTRFLRNPRPVEVIPAPTSEQPEVARIIAGAERQPTPSEEQLTAEQLYDRGHRKWEAKDYPAAIEDCTEAIRLSPNFAEAYNRRATAYMGLGEYAKAIADFDRAIELIPEYTAAYFNRGLAKADSGSYDSALLDYNTVLRLNPLFTQAYYTRALARTARHDYRGAANDYRKYLDLGGGEQYGNRAEVEQAIAALKDRWQP
ncbi:MAG: tetratricopeptide repeat protein [bacterium]|nr:tetratricopeptide repeat protein [bacterium]